MAEHGGGEKAAHHEEAGVMRARWSQLNPQIFPACKSVL